MCSLYGIYNTINGSVYIGITKSPNQRWQRHKSTAASSNPDKKNIIHHAIAKYGCDAFIFKIIENLPSRDRAADKEKEWVMELRLLGYRLYNMTDGGELPPGVKWDEEKKQKYSKRMSGRGNQMYGVELHGEMNGNYGKSMQSHVKDILYKSQCKLTDEQISEIKLLKQSGLYSQRHIANLFSISETHVHHIVKGKSRNPTGNLPDVPTIKPQLKKSQVIEMRRLREVDGLTVFEIANKFDISYDHCSSILNYRVWTNLAKTFRPKITTEQIKEAKLLYDSGQMTKKQVAEKFGINRQTMSTYLKLDLSKL